MKMQVAKLRLSIKGLQVVTWIVVLLVLFFSLLPMDGLKVSARYTIVNTLSYAIIIYGNIALLYPLFYEKKKYWWYGVLVVLLLVVTGMLRGYCCHFIWTDAEPMTVWLLLGYVPGGVLIFILSLIIRIAIAYFTLKQQTEEILLQKSQAELNLLKSQVQPHFLFNTLNNIYYKVYKVDPASAGLIERLSDIMRYFVDESPKHVVPLSTEVAFIENYMALESIRIRHGAEISFEKRYDADIRIPPMLLMTFVENVFKHGIDKSRQQNPITISLVQENGHLHFRTHNRKPRLVATGGPGGFGIANLTQRLQLLYGANFELAIEDGPELYTAFLKIPTL